MPYLPGTKGGLESEASGGAATGLRAFMLLWLGQVVSTLGSSMTTFAVGVWVYESTGSATRTACPVPRCSAWSTSSTSPVNCART